MANADSTVRVNIVGDARKLQAAVATSERSVGSLAASTKGLLAGAVAGAAVAGVIEFGQAALAEGDRLGDALGRLEIQIGQDLTASIDKAAERMAHLGQSRQDVLELAAGFADTATALGVADPLIADFADDAAATAAALALTSDTSADEAIGLIGKAAGGAEKALRALGVNLTDAEVEARAMRDTGKGTAEALTDGELAAARYALILEKLKPRLDAVAEGQGDVEQSSAELQARFETLIGKVGEGIDGPLNDLLGFAITGISLFEDFTETLDSFAGTAGDVVKGIKIMLSPLGFLIEKLDEALKLLGILERKNPAPPSNYQNSPAPDRQSSTNVQATVVAVLREYQGANDLRIL